MLAKDLIDQLERRGLLDQEIIEALREQLDQGGTRVTPEAVAKLLVDNGQLTRFQATKMIGELRSGEYEDPDEVEVVEAVADDDLLIASDGDEVVEVVAADVEAVEVEAVEVAAVEVEAVAVEAMPVEAVGVEAVAVEAVGVEAEAVAVDAGEAKPVRQRRRPPEPTSTWDSFKVYGRAGIVGFLLIAGGLLYFILSREDMDEAAAAAEKLYDNQNYEAAQERYQGFLASFGEETQYSSLARTRIIMTALYKGKAFREPSRTLEVERKQLPMLHNEEGLDQEKDNLATLLVDVADHIAEVAMKEPETQKKKDLLKLLGEQSGFIEDSRYVTSSNRTTLSNRLVAVEEARKRVERDISRNERLDAAIKDMDASLASKETKAAYDTRSQLLRDFPELEKSPRVIEKIEAASDIQQMLVASSSKVPKVETSAPAAESLRSIVLSTTQGRDIPSLRGEGLYLRAGGSVLAFSADTGKLRWRSFVGYGQDHAPVRLDGGVGVLLSESKALEIQRRKGEDGSIRWRSQIGEPFAEPVADRDSVYVSALGGAFISLDIDSGEPNWSVKIPQPLEVGAGVESRSKTAFLPGNHSNIYVINTRDGTCKDSYYLSHREGTVAVPPVPLLGHLFVIENAGVDYSLVHILKIDGEGKLTKAQDPVRMTGNVKVSPTIIQQRRLIVLTDRGQVSVYDVEPTAETDQVTVAARQLSSYDEPTSTQMAVGKSQMWITGTKIGRYELQVNTGRVVPDWFKHEGDLFIGRPFATEDALIHARVLRGTSGVRVNAVDPKTGKEIWRNDVGVPLAMIKRSSTGFHCVTSQGALFELTREDMQRGWTDGSSENPGGDGVAMRFENPVVVNDNVRVFPNQEERDQIAVYDASRKREKLRLVTLGLPAGRPSGGAVATGGGILMPLDSGRAALMRYQTGEPIASPFQPPSDPAGVVGWTNPIVLPNDPDQVVVADNRKSIYRIRTGDLLKQLAIGKLESNFLGGIAGVGDTAIGATAGPSADFVVGYDMGGLKEKFKTLLEGRVSWGPATVGDVCVLLTDDSKLRGFDESGKQVFDVAIPKGMPVGKPTPAGNGFALAGKSGWVVVVDPSSGTLTGKTDIAQPISATPLVVGKQMLVPGTEGVVYFVPVPKN